MSRHPSRKVWRIGIINLVLLIPRLLDMINWRCCLHVFLGFHYALLLVSLGLEVWNFIGRKTVNCPFFFERAMLLASPISPRDRAYRHPLILLWLITVFVGNLAHSSWHVFESCDRLCLNLFCCRLLLWIACGRASSEKVLEALLLYCRTSRRFM